MAYVGCTQDNYVPKDFQDMMVNESVSKWNIVSMETSHSPFLSHPTKVAEMITSSATYFTS